MVIYLTSLFDECLEKLRKIDLGQIIPDEASDDAKKFNPQSILDQLDIVDHELKLLEEELTRISDIYRYLLEKRLTPFSKVPPTSISIKLINSIIQDTLSKIDGAFGERPKAFQGNQIKKIYTNEREAIGLVRQKLAELQDTVNNTKNEYGAIRTANPDNKLIGVAPSWALGHFKNLIVTLLSESEKDTYTNPAQNTLLKNIINSFGEFITYSKALRRVLSSTENGDFAPLILAVCKADKKFEARLKEKGKGDVTKGFDIHDLKFALIYVLKIYLAKIARSILSIKNYSNSLSGINHRLKSDISEMFKIIKNVHCRANAVCLKHQIQDQVKTDKIIYYILEPYLGSNPELINSIGNDKAEFLRKTFEMPIVSLLSESQGLFKFRQLVHNQFFNMIKSRDPQIPDQNARMFTDDKYSRLDSLTHWNFIAYILFLTDVRNIEVWKKPTRRDAIFDASRCIFRTYSVDYRDIYSGIFYIKDSHMEDYTWKTKIVPIIKIVRT